MIERISQCTGLRLRDRCLDPQVPVSQRCHFVKQFKNRSLFLTSLSFGQSCLSRSMSKELPGQPSQQANINQQETKASDQPDTGFFKTERRGFNSLRRHGITRGLQHLLL